MTGFFDTSPATTTQTTNQTNAAMNLATDISATISYVSGLKDRGAQREEDLFFLNETAQTAALIEVCFVDSEMDVALYKEHFHIICEAIAEVLAGKNDVTAGEEPPERDRKSTR